MGNILLGIFYKIDLIKNELLFLGIKLLDIDKKALEKFSIKYNIITKFYIFFILIFFFFGFFLIVLRIIEIIKRMNYKGFLEFLLGMINFLVLYGATENFMQKFIIQEIGM